MFSPNLVKIFERGKSLKHYFQWLFLFLFNNACGFKEIDNYLFVRNIWIIFVLSYSRLSLKKFKLSGFVFYIPFYLT